MSWALTCARRWAGILLLVAAGCSAHGAALTPPPAVAPNAASGYTVLDFHYHIMKLRVPPDSRPVGAGLRYPDDLTFYGGPMMTAEAAYNIYVNCPTKNQRCWGAPQAFQTKLTGSRFAGLLRQYTNTGPESFTLRGSTAVTYTLHRGTALYENDLFAILHSVVALQKRTGYANLYHIFLPKGTDTCFDFSRQCYSPDYRPTFKFCAYHATVRFSDVGTVVYSVEPYQPVAFCKTAKSSGASELTNSTISTLAHETFESITDPGPKLAWFNETDGEEVADECQFFVSRVVLAGTAYNVQPMYSNRYHACATRP